jgi:hypothetical protein
MKTKTNPTQQATEFVYQCNQLGWQIASITDSVVTITKKFQAGCRDGLVECDMQYYDLLSLCPHKGGSVWGTDCGGIGAMTALTNGLFKVNKSGSGAKKFAAEVRKLIGRSAN